MPVIVIGADTTVGDAIVDALIGRAGEVRAFVTDAAAAERLKQRGVKVAIGDVSDASHIGGAGLNSFSAVLVAEASHDGRERSFAPNPDAVVAAWAEGLRDAGITRAIWLDDERARPDAVAAAVAEFARVAVTDRDPARVAADVARLDELAALPPDQADHLDRPDQT